MEDYFIPAIVFLARHLSGLRKFKEKKISKLPDTCINKTTWHPVKTRL